MSAEPSAAEITRKAKSNLAFALRCVPADRRQHLVSFYAFCRVIDDLADDLDLPIKEKKIGLAGWKAVFDTNQTDSSLGLLDLQKDILKVRDLYEIPSEYFTNVIVGCQMDLHSQRFGTWPDLQEYTFRVASSVGLVCLPLFAADARRSHDYAVALGHALQLTNILRDIGEDLANGARIYVPLHDLMRFQYTERDLIGRVHDGRFIAFMTYQADRCEELYAKATALLPPEDHRALLAPRVMHRIYHTLLQKMREDNFRVFDRRYRLSKFQKLTLLIKERFASYEG
ncbi:squalene/phytoene synthase family protein [bacterium]|nr:squalene/phytoene synthase family protein [bacterium]